MISDKSCSFPFFGLFAAETDALSSRLLFFFSVVGLAFSVESDFFFVILGCSLSSLPLEEGVAFFFFFLDALEMSSAAALVEIQKMSDCSFNRNILGDVSKPTCRASTNACCNIKG